MAKSEKTRAERAADLLSFYSIDELADSVGVSKRTVKSWVKGQHQPSDENFKKIYRREYYWTSGEREKTVKQSRGVKGVAISGGFEIFDLIRQLENDDIDLEGIDGNRFVDFEINIADARDSADLQEFTASFSNPNSGKINNQELISFLYRTFRNSTDRFGGSEIGVFIEEITV